MANEIETKQRKQNEMQTITAGQLAGLLQTSSWNIWRMRKDGKLPPAITVGRGGVRWRLVTILAWMEEAEKPACEIAPGLRSRAAASVESRFGKRGAIANQDRRLGRPTKQRQVEGRK